MSIDFPHMTVQKGGHVSCYCDGRALWENAGLENFPPIFCMNDLAYCARPVIGYMLSATSTTLLDWLLSRPPHVNCSLLLTNVLSHRAATSYMWLFALKI